MDIKAEEISKIIRDQIGSFAVDVDVAEVGSVVSLGDGIARVHGVERAMAGEMLEFPHDVYGIALNLEEDSVGAVLLGEYTQIKEGDHLAGHGPLDAADARDTVADRHDGTDFGHVHVDGIAADLLANDLGYLFGFDVHL